MRVLGAAGRAGAFASRLVGCRSRSTARTARRRAPRERGGRSAFGEGDARVLDVLVNEVGAVAAARSRAKHAAERQRLERVVECMADGLLFAATGADEVIANPAARRMLGAALEGPLPREWLKDALGFYPFDSCAASSRTVGPRVRPGGGPPPRPTLSSIVSPVAERDGRLAGVAVALRDVPSRSGSRSARRSSSRW